MSIPGKSISPIPAGNLVLLLSAIIGGVLFHRQAPLESRRPELEARSSEPSKNKVVARLWEDPFDVLARWQADRVGVTNPPEPDSIAVILAKKGRPLAVPVLLDRSYYPETRETRIQRRYAVLAALNTAGYERDNASVMGVGRLVFEDTFLYVPYEWFSPRPGGMTNEYNDVCLLWLEDDFLKTKTTAIQQPGQGPLSDFKKLTEALRAVTNAEVRIVGPRTSDDIQRILQEMEVLHHGIGWCTSRIDRLKVEHGKLEAGTVDPLKSWAKRSGSDEQALTAVSNSVAYREDSVTNLWKVCRSQTKNYPLRMGQVLLQVYASDLAQSAEWDKKKRQSRAILALLEVYAKTLENENREAQTLKSLSTLLNRLAQTRERLRQRINELNEMKAEEKHARDEASQHLPSQQVGNTFGDRLRLEQEVNTLTMECDFLHRLVLTVIKQDSTESELMEVPYNITDLRSAVEERFQPDPALSLQRATCREHYENLIKETRKAIEESWWYKRKSKLERLDEADDDFRKACGKAGQAKADVHLQDQIVELHDRMFGQYTNILESSIVDLEAEMAHYVLLTNAIAQCAANIKLGRSPMDNVTNAYPEGPVCSLFSPWATADYATITTTNESTAMFDFTAESNQTAELRKELVRMHGIRFNRTIHLDSQVVRTLVDELELRGVFSATRKLHHKEAEPVPPQEDIVLIGEWDSLFTRRLSSSFTAAYRDKMEALGADSSKEACREHIHLFEFLRGIDGLIPGKKHEGIPAADKEDSEPKSFSQLRTRYPDGPSQYDYLRRLASRMERMESNGMNVKAVGIFGSDPYDKLLVLRALRDNIPDAVYFTTDLDARFFHPSEMKWTRGLVVGSSYGLELQPDLQKSTPPFRNAYQTSTYATMQTLLGYRDNALYIDQLEPRIFEIGYNGPYDLSTASSGLSGKPALYPENMNRWSIHGRKIYISVGLCLILPTLILTLMGFCWARVENPGARGCCWWWAAFLLSGLAISWWFLWEMKQSVADGRAGEPLSFTDGISIWPALILRVLVFILSLYFMLRSYFSIRSDRTRIPRIFNLNRPDTAKTRNSLIRYLCWPFHGGESEGNIGSLWEEYSSRRKIGLAYLCLFVAGFLYVLLAGFVVRIDPPYTPFRGVQAWSANKFTLITALLAMTMLCGTAIYTLLRCSRFIDRIYICRNGRYRSRSWVVFPDRPVDDPANHLYNIRLIGRVTETTGRVVICPFIVLFMMILTRYDKIDLWDWPVPLMSVIGLTVLGSLIAAVQMRYKAKQVQKIAIDELKREQLTAPNKADIQFYIRECEGCDRGAFAPLASNPILLAVLTPFGGVGAIAIIQSLMSTF